MNDTVEEKRARLERLLAETQRALGEEHPGDTDGDARSRRLPVGPKAGSSQPQA